MKNRLKHISSKQGSPYSMWLLLALLLWGCNAMKYVPEDEKLYTGANVEVNTHKNACGAKEMARDVRNVIGPEPNSKLLGMRVGLWAHYKVEHGDSGFIVTFMNNRFGEEPVYLSDVNTGFMEDLIRNTSINNGFFYPNVDSEVKEKDRTASVDYRLDATYPYLLETYEYIPDSSSLDAEMEPAFGETELVKSTRFDTDLLKDERQRLNTYLKDRGYYNFNQEYLIFTTDTNQYDQRLFDLYLSLKKVAPPEAKKPYRIRDIYVVTDYSANNDEQAVKDTIEVEGIYFVQSRENFKPRHLREYFTFEPGNFYSKSANDRTTQRLSSLKYYQFAAVRYREKDTAAQSSIGSLDATVMLTPGKLQDVRFELQGVTKSTNFAGPEFIASYRHKNLFRGGEVLNLAGSVSYEQQLSSQQQGNLRSFQLKLTSSLTYPRFIFFGNWDFSDLYSVPRTKFSLGYTMQDRSQYYLLHSPNFTYGYNWNTNRFTYWEFNPVSLTYTRVNEKTPEFEAILDDNPFLRRSFEDQFIPAITGNIQYNELNATDRIHEFYAGLGGDVSGSLVLPAVHEVADMDKTIFGLPYAQYLRGDIDFRYYLQTSEETVLATRLFTGVGYPYGNSSSLPYIKQYFAGGPNSIRAFRVRSLGPGSYQPSGDRNRLSFFDQAGDIRLEFNTEYRFPVFSILKGAAFFDAGNVWLWNQNPALPGGGFSSDWSNQIAAGTGLGLRVDISVLVIRLDVAHPLRYPYERGSTGHWVNDARFTDLVWNFAIGYPF